MMDNLLRQSDVRDEYKSALDNEPVRKIKPIWKDSILGSNIMDRLEHGSITNPQEVVHEALHLAVQAIIKHNFGQNAQSNTSRRALNSGPSLTHEAWTPTDTQATAQTFVESSVSPLMGQAAVSYPGPFVFSFPQ